MEQLSLCVTPTEACMTQLLSPRAATTETRAPRAHAPQQEKPRQWEAHAQQQRPNAAKNKPKLKIKKKLPGGKSGSVGAACCILRGFTDDFVFSVVLRLVELEPQLSWSSYFYFEERKLSVTIQEF